MYYTYIICNRFGENYSGFSTREPSERLLEHNRDKVDSTKNRGPWKIIWYGVFETQAGATNFEKYLKTASGIAFRNKRLIDSGGSFYGQK